MSQSTNTQPVTSTQLLDFFRSAVESRAERSRPNYLKALRCFSAFLASAPDSLVIGSRLCLEQWLVYMFFDGLSYKTAIHYFDIISALYSQARTEYPALPAGDFQQVKARLLSLLPDVWSARMSLADLNRFSAFIKRGVPAKDRLPFALMLVSLLNGACQLSEVAGIRKEDVPSFDKATREWFEPFVSTSRKYVFPLSQSRLTPRQLSQEVGEKVQALLASRLLSFGADAESVLIAVWMLAALSCGVAPHAALAVVPRFPSLLPVLSLCSEEVELPADLRSSIVRTVGRFFLSNPLRWFAMKMRLGVRFPRLEKALADAVGEGMPKPEIFYPYEEISDRIGGRLLFRKKPVIGDIVFFRYRISDIPALFRHIGSVAWCYRSAGSYAVISDSAMALFRLTVESFTPEVEVAPAGSLPLLPDTQVVVIGGPFLGLSGEVIDLSHGKKGTVYRLRIFGDANDIEWRFTDPSLVRPLL